MLMQDVFSGGPKARAKANLKAIQVLAARKWPGVEQTAAQDKALQRFSGWGCLPGLFDDRVDDWAGLREQFVSALGVEDFEALGRSVLDSHYTDPATVKAIWAAVQAAGFSGGKALDPGCGAGAFRRFMPADLVSSTAITGVEMERTAASVASALFPDMDVINRPYQDVTLANSAFDLVVGNVPFGSQSLTDPLYKGLSRFAIHEFFIAKSLEKLRPGGLLVAVTSSYLMDKHHSAARAWIDRRAELVGAVRLPAGAFRASAGTEVVADILILRRRPLPLGASHVPAPWVEVADHVVDGERNTINPWFLDHPECVLGEHTATRGQYGRKEISVKRTIDASLWDDLGTQLNKLCKGACQLEGIPAASADAETRIPACLVDDADSRLDAELVIGPDGRVLECVVGDGERWFVDVGLSGKRKERVVGMIDIADTTRQLLRAEADQATSSMDALRDTLNQVYTAFSEQYGPVNARANRLLFREDPRFPLLASLEVDFQEEISKSKAKQLGCDPTPASWRKADIFSRPVNVPRSLKAPTTASEALVRSLVEWGRVDLPAMATWLSVDQKALVAELAGSIFECPESREWIHRDIYLGGNVRHKLDVARIAAEKIPRFATNVAALTEVQPEPIAAPDITAPINAPWLPGDVIASFIEHLLGDSPSSVPVLVAGEWTLDIHRSSSDTYTKVWGTSRRPAGDLLLRMLNDRPLAVYDTVKTANDSTTRVLNVDETAAVRGKAEEIKDCWDDWIWACPLRRRRLEARYNRLHNTHVPTRYDGSFLLDEAGCLPGMNRSIRMRNTQANAVWQGLVVGSALFDHRVGAGKTYAAIAQMMEGKRMGLINKPILVIPNHIVRQWGSEAALLYPSANILCASRKDFEKSRRRRLFARIATNDWDLIIIPQSSFKFIMPPAAARFGMLDQMVFEIADAMANLEPHQDSFKRLQKRRAKVEARLKALMAAPRRDGFIEFDELGIDHIVLDESQSVKNLFYFTSHSSVLGLGPAKGSEVAFDMFCKTRWLQDRNQGRGITFLTGTPISNSVAEMFTVTRFLCYPEMVRRDIHAFDAWARAYATPTACYELSIAGNYKLVTRFQQFVNVPELMSLYRHHAHVVTRADLEASGSRWDVAPIHTGKPELIVCPRSEEQAAYMEEIIHRYDNLAGTDPRDDNALKILGDSRKCALDYRLIDPSAPSFAGGKVEECVRRTLSEYRRWDKHLGVQLIFCDLSVPSAHARIRTPTATQQDEGQDGGIDPNDQAGLLARTSRFSVYDEIKRRLIEEGVPESEIAFLQDANTDDRKFAVQEKARQGLIRVLLTSTPLGGTGMNIQERLVAVHELDVPWRPSDSEQRRGRIERPGSMLQKKVPGFEFRIFRYGTERSGDARSYQVIELKARFVEQLRSAETSDRVIKDIGGEVGSAGEMKSALSGNPLMLAHFTARNELEDLIRQHAAWQRRKMAMEDRMTRTTHFEKEYQGKVAAIIADEGTLAQYSHRCWDGAGHRTEIKGVTDAVGNAINATFRQYGLLGRADSAAQGREVGCYRGFRVLAWLDLFGHRRVDIRGDYLSMSYDLGRDDWHKQVSGPGLCQRFDRALDALAFAHDVERDRAEVIRQDREKMAVALKSKFKHDKRLAGLKVVERTLTDCLAAGVESLPDDADALTRSFVEAAGIIRDEVTEPVVVAGKLLDQNQTHFDPIAPIQEESMGRLVSGLFNSEPVQVSLFG